MIACLSVPYFAAAVEHRDNEELTSDRLRKLGLVLGGQPWEPQPVFAFSREAALKGVHPGMSLRLAHVLSPEARFMQASPPRYLNASGEITDILTDFTDRIEPEALWLPFNGGEKKGPVQGLHAARVLPARFNIDLESLPTREAERLSQEIGRNIRGQTKLPPALGLASSKFVAQIAAALTHTNHSRTIEPGKERDFLAPQSIHFLPLDNETSRRLAVLGIRTLGQLTAIPLVSLKSQLVTVDRPGTHHSLGRDFSALYHLAKGEVQKGAAELPQDSSHLLAIQPLDQDRIAWKEHHFESPVRSGLTIERVLNRMATELAGSLQAQNLESQTVQLAIETDNNGCPGNVRELITTRRNPTADPAVLTRALQELFQRFQSDLAGAADSWSLGYGINRLSITLSDLSPAGVLQMSLFKPIKASNRVETILENVVSKHNGQWFSKAVLARKGHSLPEGRIIFQELSNL